MEQSNVLAPRRPRRSNLLILSDPANQIKSRSGAIFGHARTSAPAPGQSLPAPGLPTPGSGYYRGVMDPNGLEVLLIVAAIGLVAGPARCQRGWLALFCWLGRRLRRHRPSPAEQPARPIEAIARDARRLGRRFREPPPGMSFARYEGTRWAYDRVLAEGCHALGVVHLLGVLEPGPELDTERRRVELRLHAGGLTLLDDAA